MQKININCGLRIGHSKISYPLARITVDENELIIHQPLGFKIKLKAEEIVRFESVSKFCINGLKIIHQHKEYNSNLMVLVEENPLDLIEEMKEIGFLKTNDTNLQK